MTQLQTLRSVQGGALKTGKVWFFKKNLEQNDKMLKF